MNKLVFLDVEATGVDPDDRLIQVAYKYDDVTRNELFNPGVPIKLPAMAIHHITEDDVKGKSLFQGSPTELELHQLANEGAILVAHNAKYDLGMLEREGVVFDDYICTMKVARYLDKGQFENHQLQYLRYFYDCNVDLGGLAPHDALADVLVLRQVFTCLYFGITEEVGSENDVKLNIDRVLDRMIEISKNPVFLPNCTFPKHKNVPWAEVARIDRQYVEWQLGNAKDKGGNEDLIYTLETVLK